jgi:AcrR family transcriptional regulator
MRKASLFYHFATKEALYASVLDRLLARLAVPLGAAYSREGSVVERFDIAVDVVTAILGESPFAARLLLREAMDWGPVIRGKLLEKVLVILELTTAFVREGQQAGAFVEGDAKQLVLTSLGAHFFPFAVGQLVERYVGLDPFDPGFVAARRAEVRRQLRNMIVRPGL